MVVHNCEKNDVLRSTSHQEAESRKSSVLTTTAPSHI